MELDFNDKSSVIAVKGGNRKTTDVQYFNKYYSVNSLLSQAQWYRQNKKEKEQRLEKSVEMVGAFKAGTSTNKIISNDRLEKIKNDFYEDVDTKIPVLLENYAVKRTDNQIYLYLKISYDGGFMEFQKLWVYDRIRKWYEYVTDQDDRFYLVNETAEIIPFVAIQYAAYLEDRLLKE